MQDRLFKHPKINVIWDSALEDVVGNENPLKVRGAVLRNVAMKFAEGRSEPLAVDAGDLQGILGAKKFENEVAERTSVPGVSAGST